MEEIDNWYLAQIHSMGPSSVGNHKLGNNSHHRYTSTKT